MTFDKMFKKLKKVLAYALVFALIYSFSFDSMNAIIAKMLNKNYKDAQIQQMLKENLSEYLLNMIETWGLQ